MIYYGPPGEQKPPTQLKPGQQLALPGAEKQPERIGKQAGAEGAGVVDGVGVEEGLIVGVGVVVVHSSV